MRKWSALEFNFSLTLVDQLFYIDTSLLLVKTNRLDSLKDFFLRKDYEVLGLESDFSKSSSLRLFIRYYSL